MRDRSAYHAARYLAKLSPSQLARRAARELAAEHDMKRCGSCGFVKAKDQFQTCPSRKDGRAGVCLICGRIARRNCASYRAAHPRQRMAGRK